MMTTGEKKRWVGVTACQLPACQRPTDGRPNEKAKQKAPFRRAGAGDLSTDLTLLKPPLLSPVEEG